MKARIRSKIISIVAGGTIDARHIPDIVSADIVIGADRGALWLISHGVVPDIAIGDFDSVSAKEKRQVHDYVKRYVEYSSDKDETDLELAIEEAVRQKPKAVIIYGALGKRFDHALSAIHLLTKLESHNIYGEIVDNFNKINIVRRLMIMTNDSAYPYISLLSLDSTASVTLQGFLYDVTKKTFSRDTSLGISNCIVAKNGTIRVHAGKILVIRSSDVRVRSRLS